MCLQVPGKVIKIEGKKATIDYDIEKKEAVVVDVVPKVGEYVIVVGQFVTDIIPEENAIAALKHWKKTMMN